MPKHESPASPEPFHHKLIDSTYRPSDGVKPHRFDIWIIFLRPRHVAPLRSEYGHRTSAFERSDSNSPTLHRATVVGVTSGRNADSQGIPAWPLRHESFSRRPGGPALAAYHRHDWTMFEQRLPHRHGPARVGFDVLLSFHISPFIHW